MKDIIAKKYVNALIKSCEKKELDSIFASLGEIATANASEKFHNIITSPDLTCEQKEQFILSLSENTNKKFINFIKLLAQNDRLSLINSIEKELRYQISLQNNLYEGEITSNFEISADQIAQLQCSLSAKFDANVKLSTSKRDYAGIKIELDDLGVEVSFSLDRLKSQMVEHILKAI